MLGDMLGTPTPPQIRTGYAHRTYSRCTHPQGGFGLVWGGWGGHTVDQAAQSTAARPPGSGRSRGGKQSQPPLPVTA